MTNAVDTGVFWFMVIVFGVIGVLYLFSMFSNRSAISTIPELQSNYYAHKERMARLSPQQPSSNAPEFVI
jgi:hypothetical protein